MSNGMFPPQASIFGKCVRFARPLTILLVGQVCMLCMCARLCTWRWPACACAVFEDVGVLSSACMLETLPALLFSDVKVQTWHVMTSQAQLAPTRLQGCGMQSDHKEQSTAAAESRRDSRRDACVTSCQHTWAFVHCGVDISATRKKCGQPAGHVRWSIQQHSHRVNDCCQLLTQTLAYIPYNTRPAIQPERPMQ